MDELLQVVISSVVTIAGVAIGVGVKLLVAYLKQLEAESIARMGEKEYEANKKFALDIVKIVEERFRLGELTGSKIDEFEKILLDKVPYLEKEQLEELRHIAVSTFNIEIGKVTTENK